MAIYLGSDKHEEDFSESIYAGSQEVSQVYAGSTLVWEPVSLETDFITLNAHNTGADDIRDEVSYRPGDGYLWGYGWFDILPAINWVTPYGTIDRISVQHRFAFSIFSNLHVHFEGDIYPNFNTLTFESPSSGTVVFQRSAATNFFPDGMYWSSGDVPGGWSAQAFFEDCYNAGPTTITFRIA